MSEENEENRRYYEKS